MSEPGFGSTSTGTVCGRLMSMDRLEGRARLDAPYVWAPRQP